MTRDAGGGGVSGGFTTHAPTLIVVCGMDIRVGGGGVSGDFTTHVPTLIVGCW